MPASDGTAAAKRERMRTHLVSLLISLLAACRNDFQQCIDTGNGECDCIVGGSGFGGSPSLTCPPSPRTGVRYVCGAEPGWPSEHADCDCRTVACSVSFTGLCSCGLAGTNPDTLGTLVNTCPSAPTCCLSNSDCLCGSEISCAPPQVQVESCTIDMAVAAVAVPFDHAVAECNPVEDIDASVGGGGSSGSNCKHSGASCSSSSECCGGSICNDDPSSSFYHECE